MNQKKFLLAAMLLLSTTGYAANLDRDDAIYSEVKRFWMTQLDGGESAVIEKVKACYAMHAKPPKKSLQEAQKCIVWDISLSELSWSVSQAMSEKTGLAAESTQTSFARRENARLRATKLLAQSGLHNDEAARTFNDLREQVSTVFEQTYKESSKGSSPNDTTLRPWERNWSKSSKSGSKGAAEEFFGQDFRVANKTAGDVAADALEREKTKRSAEQGDAASQALLGFMYLNGIGLPQDVPAAVKWLHLAAEQGNALSQNELGDIYKFGNGVQQDYKKAAYWHRLAAIQGYGPAQFNLGSDYIKGLGVLLDYKEASRWYLLAAEKGIPEAQLAAGLLFAVGYGVLESRPVAYALFNLSAVSDPSSSNKAIERRTALTNLMSSHEIITAQELAKEMAKPNNLIRALDQYLEKISNKKSK